MCDLKLVRGHFYLFSALKFDQSLLFLSTLWTHKSTYVIISPEFTNIFNEFSFKFITKPPPTSWFLKKAAGIPKGEGNTGHKIAGTVGIKYIYEIAKIKQANDIHLMFHDVEGVVKMIIGTCKSLGLVVVEDTLPPKKVHIEV